MIGQAIDGRYRIVSHLSDGGMGSVYIAEHRQLNRRVAIKTLRSDVADPDTAAKRFEREARAASEIDHPNVVQVLDFGQLENGEFYYVMELLQGRDFSKLLREQGRIPWSRVHKFARQLVKALAAAHAHGIVHRDIKPANCFLLDPKPGLGDDHIKVLDFGIAKREEREKDSSQQLTQASQVIGTASYMAPEQVLVGETDPRSDIYSLGVVIYELLAGQPPFRGETPMQTINHHINTPPPLLRPLVPDLPIEAEALVMRMLAKDPNARFQSMADVEAALDNLAEGTAPESLAGPSEAPTAVMTSSPEASSDAPRPAQARTKSPRMLAFVGVLLMLGVGGWVAAMLVDEEDAEQVAETGAEVTTPPPDLPTAEPEPPPPPATTNPFVPNWTDEAFEAKPAGKSLCGSGPLPPHAWAEESGGLTGTIRFDNDPLADAQVCAWLVDDDAPIELTISPRCTIITNPKGRYKLTGLSPGNYELSTFAPGYLPDYKLPVCVWPGEQTQDVNVTLEEGGVEVRGRVRDTQGRAISGALVTVANGPRALALTDVQGRFELWVADGPLQLMAWANGYTHTSRKGHAPSDSFDIQLEREAVVTGVVAMAESKIGIPNIEIEASYRRGDGKGDGVGLSSYTDENGEFRIAGLEPGPCWVRAHFPNGTDEVQWLELEAGSNSRVAIEVAEPEPEADDGGTDTGTGTGTGTDTGDAIEEPKVRVRFVAGGLKWAELRISGQNKGIAEPTRTVVLPVGIHRVQYRQNGRWVNLGTIELEPGKSYRARLRRNGITLSERN